MVNLVNLTKFRITMETHLWLHLGACFWKGLTEQEKPPNVGACHPMGGGLRLEKRRK